MPVLSLACHLPHNTSVGEKLSWFIRHLSDGLYIFYMNLWNFPSDIWAWPSEMSDVSYVFRLHCNTPHIPSRYNNEQTTKQTKAINNSYIQLSAVITRSNSVRYYIDDYRNWSRISIRCWNHKRHPIPCPNGRAVGCILWIFVRKLTAL